MDKSIPLVYEFTEYRLLKVPSSFGQLKKEAQKLIDLPNSFLFLLVNPQGSKTPVASSQAYSRAIGLSTVTAIELISAEAQDPELEAQISLIHKKNKFRPLSNKKPLTITEETIPDNEMCIICYDRFNSPLSSKCGHVCCRACWEKTLKNYLECPMCKARVRLNQLKKV